jgi:hypothetical protein
MPASGYLYASGCKAFQGCVFIDGKQMASGGRNENPVAKTIDVPTSEQTIN